MKNSNDEWLYSIKGVENAKVMCIHYNSHLALSTVCLGKRPREQVNLDQVVSNLASPVVITIAMNTYWISSRQNIAK